MSSAKKFVGCMVAGLAASILMVPAAFAAQLVVNDEAPLSLQSPPGFSYIAAQGGQTATLGATTDGYLFCANVLGPEGSNVIELSPGHVNWTLPQAFLQSFQYSGGDLRVNRVSSGLSTLTSLVCHARGVQGDIATPFSAYGDGIFRDGVETFATVQYGNLVNWLPPQGYTWAQADWSQVPTDACNFSMISADTPLVNETSLCAAATGVRPGGGQFGTRSPTMWTKTVGSSFIYLARVDLRLGPQSAPPNSQFGVALASAKQGADLPNSVTNEIRDGFDSTYLSQSGTYCYITALPATLDGTVCANAAYSGTANGPIDGNISLSLFPPSPTASLYVAVIRTVQGSVPFTPIAAIAVMTDPGTARADNGDGFVGDNVVFGFANSGVFPWMN